MRVRRLVALLAAVILAAIVAGPAPAAMISVHYTEGVTHGFLVLRSPSGEVIADGDLLQVVRGDGVDSRLVFRFGDGSISMLRPVKTFLNYKVLATDGEIGSVSDLIVDDREMKLRYLVIDTGRWLPGKKVVLSTAWIRGVAPEKETVVMNSAGVQAGRPTRSRLRDAAARLLPLPVLLALIATSASPRPAGGPTPPSV